MKAGLGGAGGFGLRWDTYTFGQSEAHPELVDRKLIDVAAERNAEPLDCLLDLALDEPGLELRVRTIIANDDEAGVADLLVDEHCTLGLSDAGAHVGQLCDAPQATDLLGNWVRDKGVVPDGAGHPQAERPAGRPVRLRRTAATCVRVRAPTSRCSTRPPSRPVRCVGYATSRPNAERLTADAPVGMQHVVVNGTPIRVDGDATDAGNVGQVVRPSARP